MQDQIQTTVDPLVNTPQIDLGGYTHSVFTAAVDYYPSFVVLIKHIVGFLVALSFPLSVVFIIGTIIAVERLKKIRAKEKIIFNTPVEFAHEDIDAPNPEMAIRWRKVLVSVESENQNDWRQAIIEADILLDDMLTKMGYQGETLGEKLRRANSGDFTTLKQAGEAHGVRNRIAHDGANFSITQMEARQTINQYRAAFEEFNFI